MSPFITFFTYEQGELSFLFGSGLGVWYQSKGFRGGINLGIMSSSAGGFSPKIDLQASYFFNQNRFNFAPIINANLFEEGAFDVGLMILFLKKKLSLTYLHNLQRARNTSHEFYISTYYGTISIEYKKAKNLSLGGALRIPRNNIEGRYYRRGTSVYANPISFELTARYRL